MSDIYDQHSAAFKSVSAYLILKDGERVATVAFKFGNSVTAYVHWIGSEMTRGRAGGGGYDRQSAAVSDAARKIKMNDREDGHRDDLGAPVTDKANFVDHARKDGGATWIRSIESAGFKVLQAV